MPIIIFVFLAILPFISMAQYQYPVTKTGNQVDSYHGETIHDPYRWLEDDNSQENNTKMKYIY
jgi:prolyl oligopeptidase